MMKSKLKRLLNRALIGAFNLASATMGNLLVFVRPKRAHELSENGLSVVFNNNMSITDRLMRGAIFKRLEKKRDYDTLAKLHTNYWTNKGADLILHTEDLFETDFLLKCTFIFDKLKREISNQSEEFTTLVEIGTGNGKVLKYLSSEFPQINHFIGIELSANQVDINKNKFFKDKKLEFVNADGVDWVKEYGHSHTIFVTSGGVLEYFTELRLQELLEEIHRLGKTMFVAIEPNSTKHNFAINPSSQVYGGESSFSHNYPKLFKDAGFDLWHFSQAPWFEGGNTRTFIGAKN